MGWSVGRNALPGTRRSSGRAAAPVPLTVHWVVSRSGTGTDEKSPPLMRPTEP